MMNSKFIEHDEDVVILAKSEYDELQKELARLQAKVKLFSVMEASTSKVFNGGSDMSYDTFKQKVGWQS
ncbi:hypothetical protein Hs30E_00420 [Lactococcus hodotermopsidis]|uniref:Uncharacterized protein n=1 Tax=Pseudolactococcus hodotermopsidis TaxID=2709157 RepID=A0A6A0BAK6_9LACT|nr:hypothetical protein [Lactococcus hodotermopsidis]GFH41491.1 hypothetical protein Hs30E_00420 [Lactococcus hodotermopsidis]